MPLNPSWFFSRPVTIAGEVVATRAGVGIERKHSHVRSHHSIDSRSDRLLERRQIDRTQVLQIVIHQGYCQVRVGGGISVTGEVLCRRQHSVRPRAADVGRHQIAHLLRIRAESASPDDRVGRVGIYVGDGKQVPVHAQSPAFLCGDATELLGVSQVPGSAKSHRVRKHGRSEKMRRQDTPLKIPSDQQRQLRLLLELVEQGNGLLATATIAGPTLRRRRHGQRADVIFANVIAELEVAGTPPIQEFHPQADHEKLPDLLFEGKGL